MKLSKSLRIALKAILSVKLGEVKTDKAVLMWDGEEELKEGIEVFVMGEDNEAVPASDGDYTTEDGKIITVVEGKVASIKDPEAEVKPEEEKTEEQLAAEDKTEPATDPADEPAVEEETKIEDRVASLEAKMAEMADGISQIINAIAALESRLEEAEAKLAKVESEPAADPAEEPAAEEEMKKSKMSYLRKQ